MSIDFYPPELVKIPELEKFVKRPHYLGEHETVSFNLHFTAGKKIPTAMYPVWDYSLNKVEGYRDLAGFVPDGYNHVFNISYGNFVVNTTHNLHKVFLVPQLDCFLEEEGVYFFESYVFKNTHRELVPIKDVEFKEDKFNMIYEGLEYSCTVQFSNLVGVKINPYLKLELL